MKTCCLIRQKITGGKSSYTIEHLKWDALLSQYELCDVEISTSELTLTIDNKITRKNMTFIRIGTKSSSSYTKPINQYNNQVLPHTTTKLNPSQHSTTQHNTTQHGTTHHNITQYYIT